METMLGSYRCKNIGRYERGRQTLLGYMDVNHAISAEPILNKWDSRAKVIARL